MTHVATQRLIDAAANLGAGDRALLNLLIHHGIDDAALGRLLHMGEGDAAARRELLAERLSEQLGLPPADVHRALAELMAGARERVVVPAQTSATPARSPALEASPPTRRETSAAGRRQRRIGAAVAALVAATVIALVALSSGAGSRHRAATRASPHPQVQHELSLTTLPGPASAAHGRIVVTEGAQPRLTVSVAGLPPARSGHYELWLYNSIIDAQPLASLGSTGGTVTVALPAGYRRYRWLDVSQQAAGATYDSGKSVLRAALTG